jgi:ubiquinone/menaquinone biosynthesis C-methylase UbiE
MVSFVADATGEPSVQQNVRPLKVAMDAALGVVPWLRPATEKLGWRIFYEGVALRGARPIAGGGFNYGYVALDDDPADTGDYKTGMDLYAATIGEADLTGKDVLEVGCGPGHGCAFVAERYSPRSVTGLDLSYVGVWRCRRRHPRAGLTFVAGDAEKLPFPDASVDVVINVESSHCYPHMAKFLAEVRRVLRPGGLLLYADFRPTANPPSQDVQKADLPELRRQLESSGMRTLHEQDITAEVIKASIVTTPSVRAYVARAQKWARREAFDYSGCEGSLRFREFQDGTLSYVMFALQKA